MKQLTCEVCGGNDLLKQDGVFVCQSCGCKYSAQEVKKLMVQISEPVKVQGVNTIDEEIKNIDALIQMGNLKYAEQLLGEIEKKSPRNPYVWLSYAKFIFAKILTNNNDSKNSVVSKCNQCRSYLDVYYKNALEYAGKEIEQIKKEFQTLYNKVAIFEDSSNSKLSKVLSEINLGEYGCYQWNEWNENYDRSFCFCGDENNLYYYTDDRLSIEYSYEYRQKWQPHHDGVFSDRTFAYFAHKIKNIDSNGNISYDTDTYIMVDNHHVGDKIRINSNNCCQNKERNGSSIVVRYTGYEKTLMEAMDAEPIKIRMDFHNNLIAVNKYGKEFPLKKHSDCGYNKITIDKNIATLSDKVSGCYIATCVYGSYDCPEVWTLRRFRDYNLAQTWYGRAFIKTYYAISPTLVKWFGNTSWFQNFWKNQLDKMVYNLKNKGFEDKPYNDKKW